MNHLSCATIKRIAAAQQNIADCDILDLTFNIGLLIIISIYPPFPPLAELQLHPSVVPKTQEILKCELLPVRPITIISKYLSARTQGLD